MSDEQEPSRPMFEKPSTVPVKVIRADSFAIIYSNNAQVGNSFYDIRIHFNDVLSATEKEFLIEERCIAIMSPEHARDLSSALAEAVKRYEGTYGSLRTVKKPSA